MDGAEKPIDAAYIGPYKATRLWNDVVGAFKQYLPCGRHRRYMKTFDNCFSGSSAVEWLHQYIKTNGNFSSNVSRENAVSLLNKIYRAGIFEEVKVSKTMRHKQEVQDNRLYRFLPLTPSKMTIARLPLAPRNDSGINQVPLKEKSFSQCSTGKSEHTNQEPSEYLNVSEKKPQSRLARKISILKKEKNTKESDGNESGNAYPPCHLVSRVLSTKEIKDTWKAIFIQRLKKVLGVSSVAEIVSAELIDGYNVMHNCIYLNKSGLVTNIEGEEQLPHWVMSAMKCLARWPEPPEPGLPSYPGFEKDVFVVVKDYFLTQDEPLVPFHLYEIIINVFVKAGNNLAHHSSPHDDDAETSVASSLWTSASLENIILNLTKKYCMLDNTGSRYGTHEDLRPPSSLFQRHGTQEDLRFADHIDQTYPRYSCSSLPSTDAMDMLGQNHRINNPFFEGLSYGLATQESCPSLPALSCRNGRGYLSKTNHSAGEAYVRTDSWLAGVSRKYGSTPDLKVSKYETAFGPDNRTVTRVYYQNGMTTDYGHDDEDADEGDVPNAKVLENTEVIQKSSDTISVSGETKCHRNSYFTGQPLSRSKSAVDMMSSNDKTIGKSTSFVTSKPPNINLRTHGKTTRGTVHNSSFHGSGEDLHCIQRQHNTSINSLRAKNDVKNTFSNVNHRCDQKTSPQMVSHGADNDDFVHQTSFHSTNSHYSNESFVRKQDLPKDVILTPGPLLIRNSTPDICAPAINNRDANPYQSGPSEVKLCITSPPLFYASGQKTSPSGESAPVCGNRLEVGANCNSNKYSAIVSPGLARSTPTMLTREEKHCIPDGYDLTPVKNPHPPSSGYGPGYRPVSSNFGPGYKPVLDASRDRHTSNNTNLTSLQNASAHTCSLSSLTFNRQITSTPFSPSQAAASSNGVNCPMGISLSKITPFYGSSHESGNHTRPSAFMNYPQTRLSEERAKNSLQMVLLLLPPANRRKIHLLFKMMMKMTCNPNLCLDASQTTRSLVLGTFYPAILRSKDVDDFNDVVVLQLVSFILDFYADIFSPPIDMKTQVSERLKILQRPQVVYTAQPERCVKFCQQTSLTDFENQCQSTSQTALESLLESIISDKDMNAKQRLKRLKQFENTYPSIYACRFPDTQSLAAVINQRPKLKQPLVTKPLKKLKGLRL